MHAYPVPQQPDCLVRFAVLHYCMPARRLPLLGGRRRPGRCLLMCRPVLRAGKTTVCDLIIQRLQEQSVVMLAQVRAPGAGAGWKAAGASLPLRQPVHHGLCAPHRAQDSFYKSLTAEDRANLKGAPCWGLHCCSCCCCRACMQPPVRLQQPAGCGIPGPTCPLTVAFRIVPPLQSTTLTSPRPLMLRSSWSA